MFNFLAQSTFNIETTNTATDDGAIAAALAIFSGAMLLIILPLLVIMIVSMWKVFEKAGREGWKAIIPVYNFWVTAEIAGKPGWWALVGLAGVIPILGIFAGIAAFVLSVIIAIELSKSFGKDPVFALLLVLVPVVGYAILAFGGAKYVGPGGKPRAKAGQSPATN